jgi:hypothetical protein
MKVKATRIQACDLQPGDLFSTEGPDYWGCIDSLVTSIGERVYIRTSMPSSFADDADEYVFKIEIERSNLP